MDAGMETGVETVEELQRLRRQLRAQSAVNRQLHAQLEGGTVRVAASGMADGPNGTGSALTQRRVAPGGAWLKQLHMHGGSDPILVHTPTQGDFVVEGGMRRPIKAGILIAALTRVLGPPREVSDQDVQRWSEGPPVMVMESGSGPAFLVIGSRRLPLRGCRCPISSPPPTCSCSRKARSSTSRARAAPARCSSSRTRDRCGAASNSHGRPGAGS